MRSRRKWIGLSFAFIIVALALFFLWLRAPSPTTPLSIQWHPQPDALPLGRYLQGSRVEISPGILSDQKPPPLPTWPAQLPQPLRPAGEHLAITWARITDKNRPELTVQVPDFIHLDRSRVFYHPSAGWFPVLEGSIITDRPGEYRGQLAVRLSTPRNGTHTVSIPVQCTILAQPATWHVLVVPSPFNRFATDSGGQYQAMTEVVSRLAARGVQVDLLSALPKSLAGWNTVLLGEEALLQASPSDTQHLRQFVAHKGRLIVGADPFFVGTVPAANSLVAPYGFRVESKEAGDHFSNTIVAPDPLTRNVSNLTFNRPARVLIDDAKQAQLLAQVAADDPSGFVAVSREPGRGDVILIGKSMWWFWLATADVQSDNAVLLEHFFSP